MRDVVNRKSVIAAISALILLCVSLYVRTDYFLPEHSASRDPTVVDSDLAIRHNDPQYFQATAEVSGKKDNSILPVARQSISVTNNLLSLNLESYSLLAALSDVSQRSGVAIIADIVDRNVSLQVEDVPLEQGIRLLARGFDIFFFHDGATGSLKTVWAYESGKGNSVALVPAELWMTNREIQQRLANADPEERARAAETLVERGGAQAMDYVVRAVRDPADIVRYRTLQKILDVGLPLPQDVLREIMSNDPSPLARFIALDILSANIASLDQTAAKQMLEIALSDTDAPVSNHARDVLFTMQGSRGDGIR